MIINVEIVKQREIGKIGNYYGSLEVKESDGKYFWGIEDWDGTYWEEIPKYLFKALNKYQEDLVQGPSINAVTNDEHKQIVEV